MLPSAQRKLRASLRRCPPMRNNGRFEPVKITARIYGVMAVTTVLTFATLVTARLLFFPPQSLFA